MNRTSVEIEAEILKHKLEETREKLKRREEWIEELEERDRDAQQLIANQDAEITALRKKLVGVSEVLEDLLESEIKTTEMLEDCRQALEKLRAEVDRK